MDPLAPPTPDALRDGTAPFVAAAALTRQGDLVAARCLATALAFALPAEVLALAEVVDPVVSDALGAAVLSSPLAPPLREAAATALERGAVTGASLAALAEVAEGPRRPPSSQAGRALELALARSDASQRAEMDRLRHAARQLRAGEGGSSRRIAYQRDIARGAVHPMLAALVDAEFLVGVVAPMDDEVAPVLVPHALLLARGAQEPLRGKAMALIQRRWSPVAALPLSCAARALTRPKDEPLRAALLAALGALGAVDALTRCAVALSGSGRGVALAELSRQLPRALAEVGVEALRAALAAAARDADASVAAQAVALTARLPA
ncbi:MAG: hypothetical protein U0325_15395 [Polyangiales bacterium]